MALTWLFVVGARYMGRRDTVRYEPSVLIQTFGLTPPGICAKIGGR